MSLAYQEMDLGPRVRHWLRLEYPGNRAKLLARDFDVSETTAKRWLAGARPTSDVLSDMARRWGWRFVAFVFEGTLPAAPAQSDMMSELAQLRAEIASTREEIADVAARLDHVPVARLASETDERGGRLARGSSGGVGRQAGAR